MKKTFKDVLTHFDPSWVEHGYGTRFQGFQNLMHQRIRDVLLVSSLYDLFVFEEDGRLYELLRSEYQDLKLSHAPEMTRVSNGREAIALAKEEKRFDLVITTLHIEDMRASTFAMMAKDAGLDTPIVLMANDNRELSELVMHDKVALFDHIFIWQGDFRLLIAIIKSLEDKLNVDHDTRITGVQSIILIEDNVRFYSTFLPIIYLEILKQAQRLISEGINLSHKYLRTRARPKILFCKNYEEAWGYYEDYQDYILGVISDIDFPRDGKNDAEAGLKFAREVKRRHPDMPILLQSNYAENESKALTIGATFLLKDTSTLVDDLRQFMVDNFSFGDFVFRTDDGREVGRAQDLVSLEKELHHVPEESIRYHAERNHFSNWLKARTEFWLAHHLRPRKVTDFPNIEAIRRDLIASLREYRKICQRGIITYFNNETFDPKSSFARIGGGSLGGKARGLSFVNILINNYNLDDHFEGVKIDIPPAIVIGTDVFDQFMNENNLKKFAFSKASDEAIIKKFLTAEKFPKNILGDLAAFLDLIGEPLAVRSSSLLEDSQYHPFAGVYGTFMISNNHSNFHIRLEALLLAIKHVYASTYLRKAKAYFKATSYRLEEEKMAVIIQKVVGSRHGNRYYPDFSGVARSYNFYPVPPQKTSDGIVSVALGLGKLVVEGGLCLRFCPKYPNHLPQFANIKSMLKNNQNEFYAIDLDGGMNKNIAVENFLKTYALDVAEYDGTLRFVGSTYSPENDIIYDGLSKTGIRLVTFAPILKSRIFPLPKILELLLDMGNWGMGTPVEIEFAVNMSERENKPAEFGLLQMRSLVLNRELELLKLEPVDPADLICQSDQVLGHGIIHEIYDIVVVDREKFDRSQSRKVAREIALMNAKLLEAGRPYLLIGVGRWGSLDPWLGIPVTWDQISGARAIIETRFKDLDVVPSQGSHFFQNLMSFTIGYFTVKENVAGTMLDWDWLLSQETVDKMKYTKLLRFNRPVIVKMNGQENRGLILKPEASSAYK